MAGHAAEADAVLPFRFAETRPRHWFTRDPASDALLLLTVPVLEHWGDRLPSWLPRLAERPSWPGNPRIGLIIGLSLHQPAQQR